MQADPAEQPKPKPEPAEQSAGGAPAEGAPKRWEPGFWTKEVELVLFRLERDRNCFDVPHGTVPQFWRDLLKEFDKHDNVAQRVRTHHHIDRRVGRGPRAAN